MEFQKKLIVIAESFISQISYSDGLSYAELHRYSLDSKVAELLQDPQPTFQMFSFDTEAFLRITDDASVHSALLTDSQPYIYVNYPRTVYVGFGLILRLQSFNLSPSKNCSAARAELILQCIENIQPDILLFQQTPLVECEGTLEHWKDFLSQRLPEYLFTNWLQECDEGPGGRGICSKYPIVKNSMHPHYQKTIVRTPAGDLAVYNVELSEHPNDQPGEALKILKMMQEDEVPHVAAGTFHIRYNYTTAADLLLGRYRVEGMQHSLKDPGESDTFPSWKPVQRLDRVYYSGLKPVGPTMVTGYAQNKTLWASTHCPIYSDFWQQPSFLGNS